MGERVGCPLRIHRQRGAELKALGCFGTWSLQVWAGNAFQGSAFMFLEPFLGLGIEDSGFRVLDCIELPHKPYVTPVFEGMRLPEHHEAAVSSRCQSR